MKTRYPAVLSVVFLVAGCASGSEPAWTFAPSASQPAAANTPSVPPASGAPTASAATNSATPVAPSASPTVSPAAASPVPVATPVDPRTDGLEVGFGEWAVVLEAPEIRPGRVTFVVRNGGSLVHEFEIEREDGPGEGDDEFELEGPEFPGGDTVRITARLRPGTYKVYCSIGDHEDRGMVAQLVVRRDAPLQSAAPPSTQPDGVTISGFAFTPPVLRVAAGTEVTWLNEDPAEHTVTADGGTFGSETLAQGEPFSTRFDTPGTFAYFCAIHPAMRGTIEVT